MLSAFNSQKFKFWLFVSMILVVFVHSYNLEERYLQPWSIVNEHLTVTSFTEYFLANGIFRFMIPLLFAISGYLYALKDYKPYKERTNKRLRTLLVPYLIWSAAGLLLGYVMESFPAGKAMVASAGIMQIDNQRIFLHDYHWYELLARWVFFPVSYQLWFILALLMYNIAYPPLQWCATNKIAKWIFFPIAVFLWLSTFGAVLIEGEGLLFFSLGIWIQKTNFDIDKPKYWLNPLWWGIVFITLCATKTWLAFRGYPIMGSSIFPVLTVLHKLAEISGVIAVWYGLNGLVNYFMNRKWFVWLSAFSFIIYLMHAPFIALIIDKVFSYVNHLPGYRMLTFIFLAPAIVLLCISIGAILRKVWPAGYAVMTGGRGL